MRIRLLADAQIDGVFHSRGAVVTVADNFAVPTAPQMTYKYDDLGNRDMSVPGMLKEIPLAEKVET